MTLKECLMWIASTVESFDARVHCRVDEPRCQIVVTATNRPDDAMDLLIYYYQLKVRKGNFNNEDMADVIRDALGFANRQWA